MAGKGTRHRFELSRLEIAGVVISATAGLFVVFLLGVYAGRGMAERRSESAQQIVRQQVAPAVEQTPGADDALTFYDTLGQHERVAKADAADASARHAEPPPVEELGHDKVVDEPPPVVAKPAVVPPPAAPKAPEAEKPARTEAKAQPEPKQPQLEAKVDTKAAAKEPAKEAPHPASTPGTAKGEHAAPSPAAARVTVALADLPPPKPAVKTEMKGDWSVQVSATRDPRTADGVLRRLRSRGYEAYVLRVRRGSETFYRVRVGHYASLDEAQQVVSRLRREPGVPEAFVASD